jgi:hypothetical protein
VEWAVEEWKGGIEVITSQEETRKPIEKTMI